MPSRYWWKRVDQDHLLSDLESIVGKTISRPKKIIKKQSSIGYQNRDVSYPLSVSNHIPCPTTYETVRERARKHYNRMGAEFPPVPTRPRTADAYIVNSTPAAANIKSIEKVTTKHNVFYDIRTGEVVLVVVNGSESDRFYTRYYEGKATFPHINKMRGDKMQEILHLDMPYLMVIIDDEPVFWGTAQQLEEKMKYSEELQNKVKNARSCWLQLQQPMICNPVDRPQFDLPRLRFVLALDSTIKR